MVSCKNLTLRRSMLARRLTALGAEFVPFGANSMLPSSFKNRGAKSNSSLSLCDLSPLVRIGLKGQAVSSVLKGAAIICPSAINNASKQRDGSLCLRVASNEVLLLSALASDGRGDFRRLHKTFDASDKRRCWVVPYQDSLCWLALAGDGVAGMLAKLCAIDFREGVFVEGMIAQTSLARLSAVIVRAPVARKGGAMLFHILSDNASSVYLWDCLVDAIAEYDGGVVSRQELLGLV